MLKKKKKSSAFYEMSGSLFWTWKQSWHTNQSKHPSECLWDSAAWLTSEGDSLYKSTFFDASVLSQSISHLILVLSPVDAADVLSGAYGRQDKGSAQAW